MEKIRTEIQKQRKGLPLVVKQNDLHAMEKLRIGIGICMACCMACSSLNQSRYGSYTVDKLTGTPSKVVVYGKVMDYETKSPLQIGIIIKLNGKKTADVENNGNYKLILTAGKYRLTGAAMSYEFVTTSKITAKLGDSIKVDFYLKRYDKPIVN